MKRNGFIKGISLASLGAVLPWAGNVKAGANEPAARTTTCTLMPSETTGSCRVDVASNSTMLRQDIRETKNGIQLNLKLKVVDTFTGAPIPNAWVKVWHCNKEAYSSGYGNTRYPQNNLGETRLKGVQITDASGEVAFITTFPGSHKEQVTHIYFGIYLCSVLTATVQLTFPGSHTNTIYASSALYSPNSLDPQRLATDNIFADDYSLQMVPLTHQPSTGSYDSYLQVSIKGGSALTQQAPDTKGQFKLGQNYPNPYTKQTYIPFTLINTSDIEVEIYDLGGKKVASIKKDNLAAGDYDLPVNLQSLGIVPGTYIYQLVVSNVNGVFRQCKVMTGAK